MQTVLITGGSSGLGYGLSMRFADDGAQLLWVSHDAQELARAQDRLAASHPTVQVHTLVQDLTAEDAAAQVHRWASAIAPVDVLINNAGFGRFGAAHSVPVDQDVAMVQLNVLALYRLTRLFLHDMRARNAGVIVNISSNSSFQPVPFMAVYAATKGFVTQFSRALAEELRVEGSAVRVVTVCPAAIRDTPFRKVNAMDNVKTFDGLATTTVDEVVADVWRTLKGRGTYVVSGWRQRTLMWLRPFLPYGVLMALVRRETRAT